MATPWSSMVRERPSIESFEIKGNKDIKTEELTKSLRGVGLAAGKTFDRSVLEEVQGYLTDQYFSRGRYGVRIDTTVEELAGQPRRIQIDIKEGDARAHPPDQHRRQHEVQARRTSSRPSS